MSYSRRQLEALGEPFGDSATQKKLGGRIYGGGGGGPTQTSVSSTELPEWARPYAQETLQRADALSRREFTPYTGGERIAGFQPLQTQAQQAAGTLAPAAQLGQATGIAGLAGTEAFRAGQYAPGQFESAFQAPAAYTPGQFTAQQVQAPGLTQYQMAAPERVAGSQVGTPTMQAAQTGFRPDLQAFQIGAPAPLQTPEMQAAQTGYRPDLQMFQMAAPERVRTGTFTRPGTAEQYMSPYIEQALTPQLREAQRASDILGAAQSAQAAKAGALGGGRAAIMQAERQRALATQMGDIRARGLQSAYEQAQQLYGTEQQRALQAALANQQAGITAGGQNLAAALGVQQLGTQTGLQTALANLSSQQQANVQNQAAALQTQGLSAQQALQTALANQQAALGTQQLGTQAGLQTALANLSSEQQANVQNQAAALQSQGLNAQQALQAALANQQAGLTAGQTNLQALLGVQQLGAGQSLQAQLANQQAFQAAQQLGEQSRQFGAGQGLQAAGLGAQYGQAAQQLGEQSRQFGAGLGLQGLQTAQQSANILGQLGQQQFGQQQGIIGLQSQLGQQQQALEQQRLSQAYQDFLNEQNYQYRQLGFMSDLIRGLPLGQQSAQSVYGGQPSAIQNLAGLGMGAYGLSRLGGFKKGGIVQDMAEGGYAGISEKVRANPTKYSEAQIRAAVERGVLDVKTAEMALEQIAKARQAAAGINVLSSGLPEQQYAPGGIVAFDDGGPVQRYQSQGFVQAAPIGADPIAIKAQNELEEMNQGRRISFSPDVDQFLAKRPSSAPQQAYAERERQQALSAGRGAARGAGLAPLSAEQLNPFSMEPGFAAPITLAVDAGKGAGETPDQAGVAVPSRAATVGRQAPTTFNDLMAQAAKARTDAVPKGLAELSLAGITPAAYRQQLQEAMPEKPTENAMTPFQEELVGERKKAAQEAFAESQKISDRMDVLREAQMKRAEAKQKDLTTDRDRTVGIAFLEAAQAIVKPGQSLATSLVSGAAAGGKRYLADKERLDKRADELAEAINRLDEARVGDARERASAKAQLNNAMNAAKESMVQFRQTAYNENKADARAGTEVALNREAQSANFALQKQKAVLDAMQNAEANVFRAATAQAALQQAQRPGAQLELLEAINKDPSLLQTFRVMNPTEKKNVMEYYTQWLDKSGPSVQTMDPAQRVAAFLSEYASLAGLRGPSVSTQPTGKVLNQPSR